MTLDPSANRYVKHIQQIRTIQDYLVKRADRHCLPKVNNTNVDRSVAAIHATVLSALRRQSKVFPLLLPRILALALIGHQDRDPRHKLICRTSAGAHLGLCVLLSLAHVEQQPEKRHRKKHPLVIAALWTLNL